MQLWRLEEPILDKKGLVLKGGMFKHQRQWWKAKSFLNALITGYGGGKTFIGCKRDVALAIHNAPAPHLVVMPTYQMARRTTIPIIEALLAGKRTIYPDMHVFPYHKTHHEFKIRWRGREAIIWVASGDNPEALKGPNVGSARIDEPFIQDEEVFNQVYARVRDPRARRKEISLTGTPEQLNWGYDVCEGERRNDFDINVVYASTRANRAIEPDYADRLESVLTPEAAEAYVEGRFVNLTRGRIYYGFSEKNIVDIEAPDSVEYGLGLDFNVDPMAGILFWEKDDYMHIFDEIELPNADTPYMLQHVLDREDLRWYPGHSREGECRVTTVYPDASGIARSTKAPGGKSDFTWIEEFGFDIDAPHANPLQRDRENAVNGKFRPKRGEPTLTISSKCKRLKGYLHKYTHVDRHKQKEMSHLLDAMGYPVHRLCPIEHSRIKVMRTAGH